MVEGSLYPSAGVFELFGLDFVLDENLDIWFIECNGSPQLIGTNERKTKFLSKMLFDMFEIQQAYLKSRVLRAGEFVRNMVKEANKNPKINYSQYKEEFEAKINVNKIDPQFTISSSNGFQLIVDRNLQEPAALFGHISEDCINYN